MFARSTIAAAALAIAAVTTVASSAQAFPHHRPHHHRPHWGHGPGIGAGLLFGGLAAAAIASRSYGDGAECYRVRRWVETPYGLVRRTVRVCE